MNHLPTEPAVDEPIPEPEILRGKRFSIVWLIPLLAALIGVWLAVKAIRETGPTITIVFKSAEGLVPGKTEIKYKDVTVGKVQRIQLSEDLSQVLVSAAMSREVAAHLTQDTLFWIVRARVAVGEVSGINTLFSGAYIGMMPGNSGKIVTGSKGMRSRRPFSAIRRGGNSTCGPSSWDPWISDLRCTIGRSRWGASAMWTWPKTVPAYSLRYSWKRPITIR